MKMDWKKFVKPAIAVAAALATLYAVISMVQLHGLGAYRLGTEAGAFFVASYGWVLTVAILLWLVLLILLARQKLKDGGLEKLREMQRNRRRARRAKEKAKKPAETGKESAVDGEVKPGYSRKRIQEEEKDAASEAEQPEKQDKDKEKPVAEKKPVPKKDKKPSAEQKEDSEWLAKPSGEQSEYPVLAEDDGLEHSLLGKVPGVKNLLEKKEKRQSRLYDQDAEDQDFETEPKAEPEEDAPVDEKAVPAPEEQPKAPEENASQESDVPVVPMERVCPNCGALLRPGAKFCVSCGKRLEE